MSYNNIDSDRPERDLSRFIDTIFRNQDGSVKQDALYWAGHGVRSDQVGAASAHRESIKVLSEEIPLVMPETISIVLQKQLEGMMRELDACLAGKNSETLYLRSGKIPESVSSLRDLISKRTTEYIHSGEATTAEGILSKFMGPRREEARQP